MLKILAKKDLKEVVRTLVLGVFVFSLLGTGAELILLEHFEDVWMWIPLALMGASILLLVVYGITKTRWSVQAFQWLMVLFVLAGFVGVWLHFKGNMEFELEMYPDIEGFKLLWETLKGATPALAPGTMTQLGLLGLIYTFKHPRLSSNSNTTNKTEK
ncbi:MAG: hypothetical protein AB8G77_20375 [Rhodothermales bacterium]